MKPSLLDIEDFATAEPLPKVVSQIRRSFLLSMLFLGLVSLTSISISQQQSWARATTAAANDSSTTRSSLSEAVQRLLLADELANDDEVIKAGANFDNIMNTKGKSPNTAQLISDDLWSSAARVRDLLVASDRGDAIIEAVNFRKKINQLDAQRHQSKGLVQKPIIDWPFILGILGAISCLTLLGLRHKSLLSEVAAGNSAMDSSTSALLTLNVKFDDERSRTAALQKRLTEMALDSKTKASDTFRLHEILESQVDFLKNSLATLSGKNRALDLDLARKSDEAHQLKVKLIAILAAHEAQIQVNQAERHQNEGTTARLQNSVDFLKNSISEASEQNQNMELAMASKNEQIGTLKSKLKALLDEFEAQIQDREAETQENNALIRELTLQKLISETAETALKAEVNQLRASQREFRATIETDNTVLNWTNKKLTTELSESQAQIAGLKSELVSMNTWRREFLSRQT